MDVISAIAVIGVIILLGFLGAIIFERTKIPDVLLLLLIGLVLGPVFTHYLNIEFMSAAMLEFIAPYLGALALIIILFDGGLDLNYEKVMRHLGVSVLHTVVIFIVNLTLVAVLFHFIVGFPLAIAVLLGAVLSGTSSAVVIPLLAGTSASEDTRTILVLESVLTDVMCIVSVITMISILKGGEMDIGSITSNLLQPFAVAGMVGGLFAVFWLYVLKWFEGKKYAFMITIAALFVLYSFTEYVQASGAIAVLVFGLVLSNRDEFQRIFRLKTRFVLDTKIMEFHDELTFVIRTFFFVYTGMVFSFVLPVSENIPAFIPEFISSNPLVFFTFIMTVLVLILLFSRLPGSIITSRIRKTTRGDIGFMAVMLPGGLTAAVLAQVPFTVPEYLSAGTSYHTALEPYRAMFVNTVFVIIVASIAITTLCVFVIEHSRKSKSTVSPQPAIAKEPWNVKGTNDVKERSGTGWSKTKSVKQWHEPPPTAKQTKTAANTSTSHGKTPSHSTHHRPKHDPKTLPDEEPRHFPAPKPYKSASREHPLIKRAAEAAKPPDEKNRKKQK